MKEKIFLAAFLVLFTSVSLAQNLPQLPQVYIDTTMPVQTGQTFTVTNCANLQSTINSAALGDTIIIDSSLTCTGNYVLPVKTTGTGWIIIKSSALANLPPEGVRVTPQYSQYMPKIVSPNTSPAIRTDFGAHHYRFVGIEITTTASTTNLILFGYDANGNAATALSQLPHDITFDRSYIHGNPTSNVRRGITLNSASTAVIDSYISDFHEVGADSQALAGWNGPGPFKIVNNYLEGSGENVIFGGSGNVIAGVIPSDIEIRRNYFFKPLSWRVGDPSHTGIPDWTVKNSFELKNAQRVLFEGNVLQNNWAHAQSGRMVVFTPRIECTGVAPSCVPQAVVNDMTFRYNRLISAAGGIVASGRDSAWLATTGPGPSQANRVWIHDNLLEDINSQWGYGGGSSFLITYGADDLRIDHNTGFQNGPLALVGESPANTPGYSVLLTETRFIFQDNIFPYGTGFYGSGKGSGNPTLNYYMPGYTFLNNVIPGAAASTFPTNNFYPAGPMPSNINFVNYNNGIGGDYHLLASSPYKNAATDGKDVGADIDMVNQMTSGAVTGIWSGNYTPPPPAPDTTPPVISGGQPTGQIAAGTTSSTLTVSTNEAATCKYSTTSSVAYSSMTNTFTTTGGTTHSATISGLANGGSYNYYVRCQDTSPNLNQNTADYSITFSVSQTTNFGRPVSDILNQWATTPSPTLWNTLDEVTPDDTDFIRTDFSIGVETAEVKLSPVLVPAIKTGHILRVRANRDGVNVTNTLAFELRQGSTVIASGQHSLPHGPNWSTDNFTLTTAQALLITDYSDLRVRLIGNALNARVFVSWIEFEVPTGGSPPPITCGSTPASTCVSGSPPSYCSSSGTIANDCNTCGCPGSQQCNATSSACYTQGFSGLILNGRITRTTSGTPCASCTIDITLAGQTGSATTNAAGDFSIVLANPVVPGQYIADIGINDGVMQQNFKRRVTV